MDATRRTVLTIGLLFVLFGIFILTQGPQVLGQVAESAGLAYQYKTETPIIPSTLLNVAPMSYTFLPSNLKENIQVTGSVQVADAREIAFYVMNEGNFSLWSSGHPAEIVLVSPTVISSNFTFTPAIAGSYYFVFDNHDTASRVVIFNLNAVGTNTALSPLVQYAAYETLAIGIVLSAIGLKTGKKKTAEKAVEVTGWRCKFCKAENPSEQVFCAKCGRSQK